MAARSPRADATRQAILRAAFACFADHGFKATTTREIARRAGVTSPLIHHYFGDKEQLYEAAVAELIAEYEVVQDAQWKRAPDDVGFFTEGLTVLFAWMGQDADQIRFMTWARLEGRFSAPPSALALTERVRERAVAAQAHGVLRADVDVDTAMVVIDALFKGYWQQEAFYPAIYPREALREGFLRLSLRLLLEGILTPEALERARPYWEDERRVLLDDAVDRAPPRAAAREEGDASR
ncbi:MAG: helix-turn-helix domain-containing protein [Myxococcota bacterium]